MNYYGNKLNPILSNKKFYNSVKRGMTFRYDDSDDVDATITESLLNIIPKWEKTNKNVPLDVYAYPRVRRSLKMLCHYNGLMQLTTSIAEYSTIANRIDDKTQNYGTKVNCAMLYRNRIRNTNINTSYYEYEKRFRSLYEEQFDSKIDKKILFNKIREVIPEFADIVFEHVINNKSFCKIAKEMQISDVTVGNRYKKAIKILKAKLNREDY